MANTKITTNVIADDAITTAKIADDAVGNDQLASGLTLGGNTAATLSTAAQPNITSLGTLTGLTMSGHIDLQDNNKLKIGTGDDFEIYFNGTHGVIRTASSSVTGNIYIQDDNNIVLGSIGGENYLNAAKDGAVTLYYDNAAKLATTTGGAEVTGVLGLTSYIDFGTSGNRAKAGFDSNNLYIGSTSGTGEIHFKNNIGSTDAPHSSGDTKMVITDSGVGIGVASPDAKLHIEGNSDTSDEDCMLVIEDLDPTTGSKVPAILFKGNGSTIGRIRTNDSLGILMSGGSTMSDDLVVKNGPLVGIGTNDPKRMLQVGDNTQAIAAISLQTTTSGLSRVYMGENDSTSREYSGMISYVQASDRMELWTNAGIKTVIDTSGRVIIGGSTSHADGYSTAGANSGENSHYAKLWIQGNTASTAGDGRLVLASGTAWPSTGTQIGSIWFSTSWGGDHAYIACKTRGATGNTDYPGEIVFGTTADGESSPLERVRIDYNGKLLHSSTGSPDSAVTIDGNQRPYQQSDSKPGIVLRGTGTSSYSSAGSIYWGNAVSGSWGTGSYKHFHMYAHEENFHIANRNSRLTYFSQATNATWLYSSDERLKTDIEDIDLGLTVLNQLKPRKFKWKKDNTEDIGFIAQEVKPLIPIAIDGTGAAFEENEDEDSGEYHAKIFKIGNDKLIPVLVKAIQELSSEVESLKEKLNG